MNETRRKWLKRAGIFVPAAFGILPATAQMAFPRSRGFRYPAAGSCNTEIFNSTATGSTINVATTASDYYFGVKFSSASDGGLCKAVFRLTKAAGDIASINYVATLWSLSSNNLSSNIGASSLVSGNNSWSSTDVSFEFASAAAFSASTTYAITLSCGAYSSNNFITMSWGSSNAAVLSQWDSSGTQVQSWVGLCATASAWK